MTDESAIVDRLLAEHYGFVDRLSRQLIADSVVAADLRQDAWCAVLERRPPRLIDARAWLGGVVRNLARLQRRTEAARMRREQAVAQAAEDHRVEPEAQASKRLDELELLAGALRRLREPFRTVVVLRYHEAQMPRVIARRLGVSVQTVKSRLKRGLALLRNDLLSSHGDDDEGLRQGLAALTVGEWHFSDSAAGVLACAGLVAVTILTWLVLGWANESAGCPTAKRAVALAEPSVPCADPQGNVSIRVPRVYGSGIAGSTDLCRLRVVDMLTGETVPQFMVAAPALDQPLLASDEEGLLVFMMRADAPVELKLLDHLGLRPERGIHGTCEPGLLRVDVGPTYRLRIPPSIMSNHLLTARLVAADPDGQFRTCFAPLRTGAESTWVRFGADARDLGGGPPWRLELRSDDGFRFGSVLVDGVVGLQQAILEVDMMPTGCILGQVVEPDGRGVDQADVLATRTDRMPPERRMTRTDANGGFELPWLQPGTWAVQATSPRHSVVRTVVAVAVDIEATVEMQAAALPAQGPIAGVLRSETGDMTRAPLQGPLTVVLTDIDHPERTFLQLVEPMPASAPTPGMAIGTFAFVAVPTGRYGLSVHASDFAPWACGDTVSPGSPGSSEVEVWRRDAVATQDLELSALNRETGEGIADFRAFVVIDGDHSHSKVLASKHGVVHLRNVPVGAAVHWTVRAEGFETARGDRLSSSSPVELKPGWGTILRCTDVGGLPMSGVPVALDGRLVGSTDARGELQLSDLRRPRCITLAARGLIIVGGDLQPDGTAQDLIWGMQVVVARSPALVTEEAR